MPVSKTAPDKVPILTPHRFTLSASRDPRLYPLPQACPGPAGYNPKAHGIFPHYAALLPGTSALFWGVLLTSPMEGWQPQPGCHHDRVLLLASWGAGQPLAMRNVPSNGTEGKENPNPAVDILTSWIMTVHSLVILPVNRASYSETQNNPQPKNQQRASSNNLNNGTPVNH